MSDTTPWAPLEGAESLELAVARARQWAASLENAVQAEVAEVDSAANNVNSASTQDVTGPSIKETYWPLVKQELDEGGEQAWERLELDCPICFRELNIGKPKPELPPDVDCDDIESYPHDVKIAVCGHIFCDKCMFNHCLTSRVVSCPTCREPWRHINCKHNNQGRRFPRSKDDFVPKVVHEGGSLSPQCAECTFTMLADTVVTMGRVFINQEGLLDNHEWFGVSYNTGRSVIRLADTPSLGFSNRGMSMGRRLNMPQDYKNALEALMSSFRNSMKNGWANFFNRDMHFEFFAFEIDDVPRPLFVSPQHYIGWHEASDFITGADTGAWWSI
ncbi:hypothetical protein B0T10DRAFT_453502 [Thelonectria olida]|uniref:RING-type domain-containing protein n=1 Tax=Thelonectria olida TaxID=1576542 RepID=A0A9P9AXV7_9HYPO|nr:hypothetical protein B0T10DRAFT_453502 [Thelonectria olida]